MSIIYFNTNDAIKAKRMSNAMDSYAQNYKVLIVQKNKEK